MTKKYWIWGGLIGLFLACGAYYYLENIGDSTFVNILLLPVIVGSIAFFGLNDSSHGAGPFVLCLIYGFVIGAIVGWIWGKIRSKKRPPEAGRREEWQ